MTTPKQQARIDAAVAAATAEQKAKDDLVIAGLQASLNAAAQTITDQKSTMDLQGHIIDDQAAEIERLKALLDPPAPTMLVGAYCGWQNYPQGTETKAQARARVTALLGGLPVERCFMPWDSPQSGVPAIVSTGYDPASVLSGSHDADIAALATNPDVGWLCDRHEPDQAGRAYDWQAHVAASQHFYTVAHAANPDVKIAQIYMTYNLLWGPKPGTLWQDFYPGDDYCDVIGWDWYGEPYQKSQALAQLPAALAVNKAHGKPLIIAEMGVGKRRASSWADFTDDQRADLLTQTFAALADAGPEAVTFFYTNKDVADWTLDRFPKALAVLRGAVTAIA